MEKSAEKKHRAGKFEVWGRDPDCLCDVLIHDYMGG